MAANPVPIQPRNLEVKLQTSADGTPTLVCRGRISTETSGLWKSEVKKLVPEHRLIIVDLGEVSYVDSSGLGTLLATYVSAKTSGCTIQLVHLNERVKELLRLSQLAAVFEGYGEYL